ncbi:hypothetical protein EYS14_11215 [Alteromonadaceae bacterium M269]|nr:hypothetical protein EYS14_11215 [Alteromonadaceae bacterium M269]
MTTAKEEITLMARYGITCEQKLIYQYKRYRYNKLDDAINFAKLDSSHANLSFTCEGDELDQ